MDFHFIIRKSCHTFYYPQYANLRRNFSNDEAYIMTPFLNLYEIVDGTPSTKALRLSPIVWSIICTSWSGIDRNPNYAFDCITATWYTSEGVSTPPINICEAFPILASVDEVFSINTPNSPSWAKKTAKKFKGIFSPA